MGKPGNLAGSIHHKSEHTQIIPKKTFPNPKERLRSRNKICEQLYLQ